MKYSELLQTFEALINDAVEPVSILSNTSAFLMQYLSDISWVGFYLSLENNEFLLGPFQGKVACTTIAYGKGVCGTAAKKMETILVPNVHEFPGHIACDAATNSEIVVPLEIHGTTYGVLDVDSISLNRFTTVEQDFFEAIAIILTQRLEAITT